MEEKINALPDVSNATLTFATHQLRITAKRDPDILLDQIRKICTDIENDVKIKPKDTTPKSTDTCLLYTSCFFSKPLGQIFHY